MNLNQHDFLISNCDTDSISFCKSDMSPFDSGERLRLIVELNQKSPEFMNWDDDGLYKKVLIVKAKNYVLVKEDDKIIYKGGSIKATLKCPALKEFIKEIINEFLNETNRFMEVYNRYVFEINDIKDIKRWSKKSTITDKVLTNERTNEVNVRNAIENTEYKEGDKIYTFFDENGKITLVENFKGCYNKEKLYKNLYDTLKTFNTVLNMDMFLNYALKRNKKQLEELLDEKTIKRNT